MSNAVATISHIRGETITFGLRATDPVFDGTETVTCDIKPAINGSLVPPRTTSATLSIAPTYSGGEWLFTITPTQSDALSGRYVADAKILLTDGFVDHPAPIIIAVSESVTA